MKKLRDWYINVSPVGDNLNDKFYGSVVLSVIVATMIMLICTVALIIVPFVMVFGIVIDIWYFMPKRKPSISKILDNHEKRLFSGEPFYKLEGFANPHDSLEDFVKSFVLSYRHHYCTINALGNIICYPGKRRSIGDIFLICKYYYPGCTLQQVLGILVGLLEDNKISGGWCSTINKFVFHYDSSNYGIDNRVEYDSNIKFRDVVNYFNKKK